MDNIERLILTDLDYITLILEGFKIGVITGSSTLLISKAINFGLQLLKKS